MGGWFHGDVDKERNVLRIQVIFYHVTVDLGDLSFDGCSRKTVPCSNHSHTLTLGNRTVDRN